MLLLILNFYFHLSLIVRVKDLLHFLSKDASLLTLAILRHWLRRRFEKVQRFSFVFCAKKERES